VDLVEVNPPLVVWMGLPLVRLAGVTGWSEVALYRGMVWAVVGVSLLLSARMLGLVLDRDDGRRRAGLLLVAVFLLAAMPGPFFGQREHLALALVLPWLFGWAARIGGLEIPTRDAMAAGVLAAVGVALKPHYVFAALAIGGYVCARRWRTGRRMVPELAVMAGLLVCYAAAVMIAAPEYLPLIARLKAVYWDYVRRPIGTILGGTLSPLTVVASLLLWPVSRYLTRYRALADVLGIATLGFLGAVVLQHKGFGYHYYPSLGTGLLLLLLGTMGGANAGWAPWPISGRAVTALVALPCLTLFLLTAIGRAQGSAAKGPVKAGSREIGAFLRGHRPTGAVVIFSPWMEDSFPLVLESDVSWGSRYPFMWFMPALHRTELTAGDSRISCRRPASQPAVERALVGTVAEDLGRYHPELVFVRRPDNADLLRVNLLACFSRHSTFRREFAAYRQRVQLGHFIVFERIQRQD